MSYFKPYVDENGYHYPTYNEILEDLIERMQQIYGSGIYLGNDSQDYQMLAAFAEKTYDCFQVGEISYNAHSPLTAIGTGLDYVVAINGIKRKVGASSTVTLALTGTPGTTINNGQAADSSGNIWQLPEVSIIGDDGTASVEAYCLQPGVIQAAEDTVTRIMTPTQGWESVTNPGAASTGTAVETDSQLRGRQGLSVAQPSQSIVKGLKGHLQGIENVQRVEVYENDKGVTDANGIPAHTVCAVVEGGDDTEIAEAV